jgi:hypothetical protein
MKDLSTERPLRFEATPFYPHAMMTSCSMPFEFAIYNDGQPCMMATCEAQVSNILHGIQDDALDEGFPPDAQEAAELEEVESFNEMQALLALLEERDQQARSGFCHIKKRWEVRRSEGMPIGRKPKAATSNKIDDSNMMHAPRSHVTTKAMIPYAHHQHHCNKVLQDAAVQRSLDHRMMMKGSNKGMKQHAPRQIPIQQPRKQS